MPRLTMSDEFGRARTASVLRQGITWRGSALILGFGDPPPRPSIPAARALVLVHYVRTNKP